MLGILLTRMQLVKSVKENIFLYKRWLKSLVTNTNPPVTVRCLHSPFI